MTLDRRTALGAMAGAVLLPAAALAQQPKRDQRIPPWTALPVQVKRDFFIDRKPLPKLGPQVAPPLGWLNFSAHFSEHAHFQQTHWSLLKLTEDDFKDIMDEQDRLRAHACSAR